MDVYCHAYLHMVSATKALRWMSGTALLPEIEVVEKKSNEVVSRAVSWDKNLFSCKTFADERQCTWTSLSFTGYLQRK